MTDDAHEWKPVRPDWQRCGLCDVERYQPPGAPDDGLVRDPATDAPIPCRRAAP